MKQESCGFSRERFKKRIDFMGKEKVGGWSTDNAYDETDHVNSWSTDKTTTKPTNDEIAKEIITLINGYDLQMCNVKDVIKSVEYAIRETIDHSELRIWC